jgi:hypothetical protein
VVGRDVSGTRGAVLARGGRLGVADGWLGRDLVQSGRLSSLVGCGWEILVIHEGRRRKRSEVDLKRPNVKGKDD